MKTPEIEQTRNPKLADALEAGYLRELDAHETWAANCYAELADRSKERLRTLSTRKREVERSAAAPLKMARIVNIQSRTSERANHALERIERAVKTEVAKETAAEKTMDSFRLLPIVRDGKDFYALTPKISRRIANHFCDEFGFVPVAAVPELCAVSHLVKTELPESSRTSAIDPEYRFDKGPRSVLDDSRAVDPTSKYDTPAPWHSVAAASNGNEDGFVPEGV